MKIWVLIRVARLGPDDSGRWVELRRVIVEGIHAISSQDAITRGRALGFQGSVLEAVEM